MSELVFAVPSVYLIASGFYNTFSVLQILLLNRHRTSYIYRFCCLGTFLSLWLYIAAYLLFDIFQSKTITYNRYFGTLSFMMAELYGGVSLVIYAIVLMIVAIYQSNLMHYRFWFALGCLSGIGKLAFMIIAGLFYLPYALGNTESPPVMSSFYRPLYSLNTVSIVIDSAFIEIALGKFLWFIAGRYQIPANTILQELFWKHNLVRFFELGLVKLLALVMSIDTIVTLSMSQHALTLLIITTTAFSASTKLVDTLSIVSQRQESSFEEKPSGSLGSVNSQQSNATKKRPSNASRLQNSDLDSMPSGMTLDHPRPSIQLNDMDTVSEEMDVIAEARFSANEPAIRDDHMRIPSRTRRSSTVADVQRRRQSFAT
ncbi:hypothetical protein EDD86DRAFT_248470 [Gorgonomyces haynaldii]|nr:hypothetical protein EDD86DRAFT_248470 [Gorgonomyces haynaldii]